MAGPLKIFSFVAPLQSQYLSVSHIFFPYPKGSSCSVPPRIQESYFREYCFDLRNTTDIAACYKLLEMFIKTIKEYTLNHSHKIT